MTGTVHCQALGRRAPFAYWMFREGHKPADRMGNDACAARRTPDGLNLGGMRHDVDEDL